MNGESQFGLGGGTTRSTTEIQVAGKICKVELQHSNNIDTSNLIEAPSPAAIAHGGSMTVDGKTYAYKDPADRVLRYKAKIVSFALQPQAPKVCTEKNVTLLYDLEKRGKYQEIENPLK